MQLEFTYTRDDIKELGRVHVSNLGKTPGRFDRGIIGWVVFISVALGLIWLLKFGFPTPSKAPKPAAADSEWPVYIWPAIFLSVAVLFWFAVRRAQIPVGGQADASNPGGG